jgi:hypothetical protein
MFYYPNKGERKGRKSIGGCERRPKSRMKTETRAVVEDKGKSRTTK